jgi:hypothetical protein
MLPNLSSLEHRGHTTAPKRKYQDDAPLAVIESKAIDGYNVGTVSVGEMIIAVVTYKYVARLITDVGTTNGPRNNHINMVNQLRRAAGEYTNDKHSWRLHGSDADMLRWERIRKLPNIWSAFDSDENRLAYTKFLEIYLRERGLELPTKKSDFDVNFRVLDEYVNHTSLLYVRAQFKMTSTLRVYRHGSPGCIGIVMMNTDYCKRRTELAHEKYELSGGLPVNTQCVWYMQGITSCPFFRDSGGVGVGSTLLSYVQRRVSNLNFVVMVDPIGSRRWMQKLASTQFVALNRDRESLETACDDEDEEEAK